MGNNYPDSSSNRPQIILNKHYTTCLVECMLLCPTVQAPYPPGIRLPKHGSRFLSRLEITPKRSPTEITSRNTNDTSRSQPTINSLHRQRKTFLSIRRRRRIRTGDVRQKNTLQTACHRRKKNKKCPLKYPLTNTLQLRSKHVCSESKKRPYQKRA